MGIGNKKAAALIFKQVNIKHAYNRIKSASGFMIRLGYNTSKIRSISERGVTLRQYNLIDCVLERRGDEDAGAIFVHIDALTVGTNYSRGA